MKLKKWVVTLLFAFVSVFGLALTACNEETTPEPIVEGPETGVYYFDAAGDEYSISMNGGNRFSFAVKGANKSGTYTVDGETITFVFSRTEDGSFTAQLANDVLTFTYDNSEMRFLKKIPYSVTFETNGGSAVEGVSVINGKTMQKPADPTRDGYVFIGWYTDEEYTKPFTFGSDIVTADTKLYAYWGALVPGFTEFTVKFDLNYENAATLDASTTIGGKLYRAPAPSREGYEFKGWWMSLDDNADRLTNQYTDGTVFKENTTLFALWQKNGETVPALNVTSDLISWDKLSSGATLTISDAKGNEVIQPQTIGATAGNTFTFDFSTVEAGDYVVVLTVGETKVTRYYRNRALDRVSQFTVVGNSVLLFHGVDGAEKYTITVECGEKDHRHTALDLGTSTNYNFVNCAMQEGGIRFTVTASAEGYASSTGTYVHNPVLDAVTGYAVNEEGSLVWDAVKNASSYLVSVNGGAYEDIGGKTSFSLKEYSGEVKVSVYARTKGYNSPEATTYTYQKDALATPANIRIIGDILSWDAVNGATSYEVKVDDQTFSVAEGNEYNLAESGVAWAEGADYRISVMAKGAKNSLWSDEIDARYYAMSTTLSYYRNTVSWNPVIKATAYDVRVNNGSVTTYSAGETSAEVTLTKAGNNTISVRYKEGENVGAWVSVNVYAFAITFDTQGGTAVAPVYRAVGDALDLTAETEQAGYDLSGWYNVPGAAHNNGSKYTEDYFTGNADTTMYAYWTPKTFEVTLNYGEYVSEGYKPTAEVVYLSDYKLPVPAVTDGRKVFKGWYGMANGKGLQYTGESGESVSPWGHTMEGYTLYAYYIDGLEYTAFSGGNAYSVKAGEGIGRITNLFIPKEYEGKPVTDISDLAFKDCTTLLTISIPNTVEDIADTAFMGCTGNTRFIVRDEGAKAPKYSASENGTLIELGRDGFYNLKATPLAAEGVYEIPAGVTKIPQLAFKSMSNVTEVVVPASVRSILKEAFDSCKKLTKITFLEAAEGETVDPLSLAPDFIASTCTAIETITFPSHLGLIDESEITLSEAFQKLNKLTAIEMAKPGKNYSALDGVLCNAYDGRTGDTIIYCPLGKAGKFVVPEQITKIADRAFAGRISTTISQPGTSDANKLTELEFHGHMLHIGEQAFYNNRLVEKITFKAEENPTGLTIEKEAFLWCTSLKELIFEEEGTTRMEMDGDTPRYVYEYTKSCGVVFIGENAFANCKESSLMLPSTLVEVKENAFRENKALTNLDLSHIRYDLVFGDFVFNGCTGLLKVEITKNVGYVSFASIFYKCTELATVQVSDDSPYYSTDSYGVLYNKDKTAISFYPEGLVADYVIPDTIVEIGGGVFSGKKNLKKINIPKSVKTIGKRAFADCVNLTEVTFEQSGDTPLKISEGAFYNCEKLTGEIRLPGRTETIEKQAFYKVGSKVIILNEGLKSIGEEAFNSAKVTSITIPSTVTKIDDRAFNSCSSLVELIFAEPQARATAENLIVGKSAFLSCGALVSVELPERLLYVSEAMFKYCDDLTSVTIPTTVGNYSDGKISVRGVEKEAFYGCSDLATVIFTSPADLYEGEELKAALENQKPLSFGTNCFMNTSSLEVLNLPSRISKYDYDYDFFAFYESPKFSNGGCFNVAFASYSTTAPSAAIREINIEEGGDFVSLDGIVYTKDYSVLVLCPLKKTGTVVIPWQTATIAPSAFRMCSLIETVEFEATPADKTEVEFTLADAYPLNQTGASDGTFSSMYASNVFYGCSNLQEIAFPARLTSIGAYALASDGGVYTKCAAETITFGDEAKGDSRLTAIGKSAFKGAAITEFTLPDGVKELSEGTFEGCKGLTHITINSHIDLDAVFAIVKGLPNLESMTIPEENPYVMQENGVLYNKTKTALIYVFGGVVADNLVIPKTVTEILSEAFAQTTAVKNITFEKADEGAKLTMGDKVFTGTGLTSIVLPAHLESIGASVFEDCKLLESVTFAEGYKCTGLPENTFKGCTQLKEIKIPRTVTSIGDYAFSGCASLAKVEFEDDTAKPSELQKIGVYAFSDCKSLTEIHLPQNVIDVSGPEFTEEDGVIKITTKGNYTFSGCTSLTKVTLPKRLQAVGQYMFKGCTLLTEITMPDNLVVVDNYAFYQLPIEAVELPATVRYIGSNAFYQCKNLKKVVYNGNKAGVIGTSAFSNCSALEEFTFATDANVRYIFNSAFRYCTSLTSFEMPDTVLWIGGSSTTSAPKADLGSYVFGNCTALNYVKVSNVAEIIAGYAFRECTALKTVDFGTNKNLKILGQYAFYQCENLESIRLPAGLTRLEKNTFEGCIKMKTADLSGCETLASLDNRVFYGCEELTTVNLPKSLRTIGNETFRNCTKLQMLDLKYVEKIGDNSIRDCPEFGKDVTIDLSSVKTLGINCFFNAKSLSKVIFKNIEVIGAAAFGNTGLEVIPQGDVNVKDGMIIKNNTVVFYYGDAEELTIPDGITRIGNGAFWETDLKKITLPESVKEIGDQAFGYASYLESINLENVEKIEFMAFRQLGRYLEEEKAFDLNFNKLTTMANGAFEEAFVKNVTFGALCAIAGGSTTRAAFRNCKMLETVTFTESSAGSTVGSYAFVDCTALKKVVLNGVKSYGTTPFRGCTALEEAVFGGTDVTVGASLFKELPIKSVDLTGVKQIYQYAFQDCAELKTVTFGENSNLQRIASYAFRNCTSLESIVLPDTVQYLGGTNSTSSVKYNTSGYVFAGCSSLKEIRIPVLVKQLGTYMFQNCIALGKVEYGLDQLEKIGTRCFEGCESLTAFDASKLTYIGNYAFSNCTKLTEMDVSSVDASATALGTYTFQGCTSLTKVSLPTQTVTTLGTHIFENCTSLTSVTIPAQFKKIDSYAFAGCTALVSVNIPESATAIQTHAFDGCTSLKNVTFDGVLVDDIYSYAFAGCTSLTEIDLSGQPLGATRTTLSTSWGLREYVFKDCTALTQVKFGKVAFFSLGLFENCPAEIIWVDPDFQPQDDGALYNAKQKSLVSYNGTAESFKVKDGITTIAPNAFAGNTTLKSIDLNGVTKIETYAFYDCTALAQVTLTNVTSLGAHAFENCTSLETVDLIKVTSLGAYTFANCTSLETIDLSKISSYSNCGTYTFSGCTSLSSVVYPSKFTSVSEGLFQNCSSLKQFDFSNITLSIGKYAFAGTGLEEVTIASTSSTPLYNFAFANCLSLRSVTITGPYAGGYSGYGETTYYSDMFLGCTALEEFTLVTSATSTVYIGDRMFAGCTSLNLVDIELTKSSATLQIRANAFEGCENLTEFDFSRVTHVNAYSFKGTKITEAVMPKISYLYENAFAEATALKKVVIENYDFDTSIYDNLYKEQFKGCTALEEVSLPSAVRIATSMFEGCTALKSIYLPSATTIYASAFAGCTALTTVTMPRVTEVYEHAFEGCSSLVTVDCPKLETVRAYAFADCSALKEIDIINVTSLAECALKNCVSIDEITLSPNITIPNANAFEGWTENQTIHFQELSTAYGNEWMNNFKTVCSAQYTFLE